MKIIVSVRDAIGTGGGTVAINTSREMSKMGHEVVIVSDYPVNVQGCKNEFMPLGKNLHIWQPKIKLLKILRHFLQLLLFSIWGRQKLKKYESNGYYSIDHNIESFGADILVMHNVFSFQFLSDQRPFIYKIKQLLNPIFLFRILREWMCVNFGRSKLLVSVSEASVFEVNYLNKKNKEMRVIENGVDLNKFTPLSFDDKSLLKEQLGCLDKFIILFVGHEFVRKRLDLAIETLSKLDDRFVLWVIGGRSENLVYSKELVTRYSLENRVTFLGAINAPEKYMAVADCFILLSDYETWGMVAVEALATGTPCVMTNVGCAPSVIKNGYNGYIVNNSQEACDSIIKIEKNIENIDYQLNSRSSVEKYSWEKIGKKYSDLISELF